MEKISRYIILVVLVTTEGMSGLCISISFIATFPSASSSAENFSIEITHCNEGEIVYERDN